MGKEDFIGSIEEGKDADLVFKEIPEISSKSKDDIISEIVYLGNQRKVFSVWIAGKRII